MTSKLFVGGLAWATTDASLRTAFEAFGEVTDAKVITDRETGRSRGFGFVTFGRAEDAALAMQEMDGAALDGRNIRVNEAQERRRDGGGGRGPGGGGPPRRFRNEGRDDRSYPEVEHRRAPEDRGGWGGGPPGMPPVEAEAGGRRGRKGRGRPKEDDGSGGGGGGGRRGGKRRRWDDDFDDNEW
ncbi:MAG: RNA recognition motif domain-containing protein [Sandaracinaceae bacterium]